MNMNEVTIKVVVRLKTTEKDLAEDTRILTDLVKPTRSNPGNIEFRVLQDTNDATQFTLIENWQSMAAVDSHAKEDYMAEFTAKKDQLFPISTGEIVREF